MKVHGRLALATVLIGLTASAAHAADVFDDTGFNPYRTYFSELPYEHVDPLTGNLLLTFTDLVLPGNAGFDLRIQRTYNSKIYPNYPNLTLLRTSWAGVGWTLHLGRVFHPLSNDASAPVIEMPDGSQHAGASHIDGSGLYITRDYWVYDKALQTLSLTNGVVYTFGHIVPIGGVQVAYVTKIVDPFGNEIDVAYNPGGTPPDAISTITQTLGNGQARTVTFGLAPSTPYQLASMTYQDANGLVRVWTYGSQISGGLSLLRTVLPPVGPGWSYDYTNTTPRYEVKKITTPNGGQISYLFTPQPFHIGTAYAVTSRAVMTRTTESVRGIPSGTWNYFYEQGSDHNQTTITSPCGTTMTYTYRGVGTSYTYGGTAWDVGLPLSKTVTDGTVTETEALDWIPSSPISFDQLAIGTNHDAATYVPLVHQRTVTRADDPNNHYITTNSYSQDNLNDYGRPYKIDEGGQLSRTATRGFQYGFLPYIVDRLAWETVAVGGESFTRSFTYDSNTGFTNSKTVYGIQTTFSPGPFGNVASSTDANGNTTGFTHSWGMLENTKTPVYTITRAINPDGTVASETRNGFKTSFYYDPLFRPIEKDPPVGNPIKTTYDSNGAGTAWVSTTVTRGPSKTVSSLDGLGRVVQTKNSVGVFTTTQYDVCGRKAYESYPFDTTDIGTGFQYDGLDRLKLKTNTGDNPQTSVTYTYAGIDVDIKDENGHTTHQGWSAFGDPRDARLTSVRDARGSTTSYSYNALGNLTKVSSAGSPDRAWHYNDKNLLDSETHPETGTITYTYYAAGNLLTRQDRQFGTTTFTYDRNTRLTGVDRPGTAYDTTFEYDDADNRTLSQNSYVRSEFHYDGANRLYSRTDVVNGQSFTTGYDYNDNDFLRKLTYPSSQKVTYVPDSENRIKSVGTPTNASAYAGSITYHPSGAVASYTAGNGLVETLTYDGRYRVKTLDSGAASSSAPGLLSLGYTYDNVGNVTKIADSRPGMTATFDSYDEIDRLTSATGYWGSGTFGYDSVGNRTSTSVGGSATYTYDFSTQRLTWISPSGESFTYDANGNTKTDGAGRYVYTPADMLETATVGGTATTYRYDGDNLRTLKLGGGLDRYYVHGPGNQILSEFDLVAGSSAQQSSRDYVYAGARLLATVTPPVFAASPVALSFAVVVGDTTSSTQTVSLTYAPGTASASWQAKVKGTTTPWLQVSPASGTTPSTLSVSVDPTGLALGTYTGTVQVTAKNALGSPQQISVTLVVVAAPVLTALPSQLSFIVPANGVQPPAQAVSVVYPGASVPWQAAGTQSWLSLTPASGATPSSFSVSANGAGLSAGTYTDTITVISAGTAGSPVTIPVELVIEPPSGETCATGAWYCEPFDELAVGGLGGQGGWQVVGQSDTAQVDVDPRFIGNVGIFDAPAGGVEKNQVNLHGTHLADRNEISLQVMQTGARPKGKHIAKIEFFTDSGYFGKTGRTYGTLRIGARLDLQYGANISQELVPMESGRFYEVLIQYYHGYLFAYVDGALKFTTASNVTPDKPMKAFATTAWDYPGFVDMDILQARPTPPLPVLLPNPSSLTLESVGGTSPSQAMTVSGLNLPSGSVWQATVDQPWLTVEPSSGTVDTTAVVTATPGTLAPGTYVGNVTLTCADALNSPVVVPVTFVIAPAQLVVTPSSLALSATAGSQGTATLTIDEAPEAGGPTWQAATDQPWLAVAPASGVGPATVLVTADPTGLATGIYAGNVTVTTTDAGAPVVVPVTFQVAGFYVSPASLNLTYPAGGVCPGSGPSGRPALGSALKPGGKPGSSKARRAAPPAATKGRPVAFEPNRGQFGKDVLFVAHGQRQDLLLGLSGIAIASHANPPGPVTLTFKGAGAANAEALDVLPGKVNYLRGSDRSGWITGVPRYARARYRDIYPGIDLVFHGEDGRLEHDWIVSPGKDPGRIETEIGNARSLHLDVSGDLVIETSAGRVLMERPAVYQEVNGERRSVPARYVLHGPRGVRFAVEAYDRRRALVIDPVLTYSSYLGGSGSDVGQRIAVDAAGNVYVAGTTSSTDFPVTSGVVGGLNAGHSDAFVAKLDPSGNLIFATYFGGSGDDSIGGLAVKSTRDVVIAGTTSSQDLPLLGATLDSLVLPFSGGPTDGFVTTLSADGTTLIGSTYLGGTGTDSVAALALGADDAVYLTGSTNSLDFSVASSNSAVAPPLQGTLGGNGATPCDLFDSAACPDAFVTKLDALGVLVYSTYYGGTGREVATGIALGPDGSVYIAGNTNSASLPVVYPLTQYGVPFDNAAVPFLAALDPSGSALNYATWLAPDWVPSSAAGLAVDASGAAYVVGSTSYYFPLGTPNGYQQYPHGFDQEGFALKIAPDGHSVIYGTFLGGSGDDSPAAVVVDGAGNAHIAGTTNSLDFPSPDCLRGYGGGQDAFLATLSPDGTQLLRGTFFGGSGDDRASDLAFQGNSLYVIGSTESTDLPLVNGLKDHLDVSDAFVATVGLAPPATPPAGTILLDQVSATGYEADGYVTVYVGRMCGEKGAVSVGYHTTAGSAIPGLNYSDVSGTVSFDDQDVGPKAITVPLLNDQSLTCDSMTFDFFLDPQTVSPPGTWVGLQKTTVSMVDNTAVPTVRASLSVQNLAGGPVDWTAVSDSPWLTLDIASGTTPSTVVAIADRATLADGTYTGQIIFTLPATGAQIIVPVTFDVGVSGGGGGELAGFAPAARARSAKKGGVR